MKYKVYIPSRGRCDNNLTAKCLGEAGISFTLVVEQREHEAYAAKYGDASVVALPGNDYGGVHFARNFIKKLSIERGEHRHWQLDDDIRKVYLFSGRKANYDVPIQNLFGAAERFVEQFDKVAIAGLSSDTFARLQKNEYATNAFAYTCFLAMNTPDLQWCPGVEDDLDYNLQALTAGWFTLRFNKIVFRWSSTESQSGGYTDIYANGQRYKRMEKTLLKWPTLIPGIAQKKGGSGYRLRTEGIWRKFKRELIPATNGLESQ